MKIPKFNCRAVLICESFMMCSALAASVLMDDLGYDIDKCSISYIRHLVEESCVRHLRARREENIHLDSAAPHRFDTRHVPELPVVPLHLLPKNVNISLVAKRRSNKHVKRATGEDHSIYFVFCCEHMDICENLDCP